ncbi:MAG TPA: hypothetical protein VN755_06355, partial [Steroidobacteraceae bacterium]|nr:hypothetical protein [Steroidobacteraceae bacterium]
PQLAVRKGLQWLRTGSEPQPGIEGAGLDMHSSGSSGTGLHPLAHEIGGGVTHLVHRLRGLGRGR